MALVGTFAGARLAAVPTTADDGKTVYQLQVVGSVGGGGAGGLSANDLRSNTGTFTSVPSGTSSVTILAANTARKGATITNTDANPLRLDLSGGTASGTRFTYALTTGQFLEVPFGYAGAITGVWDADGTGAAIVTEFS